MPLYAMTHSHPLAEMVRGLIDIYRNEGYMPDCYMGMGPGYSQGGSNAEMPLTDFLLKHGPNYGGVSWEDGFQAMIKDATVVSLLHLAISKKKGLSSLFDADLNLQEPSYQGWTVHGRTDIDFYSENGYVPAPEGSTYDSPQQSARSASRTIEYSRNDFAIALAAHSKCREHRKLLHLILSSTLLFQSSETPVFTMSTLQKPITGSTFGIQT